MYLNYSKHYRTAVITFPNSAVHRETRTRLEEVAALLHIIIHIQANIYKKSNATVTSIRRLVNNTVSTSGCNNALEDPALSLHNFSMRKAAKNVAKDEKPHDEDSGDNGRADRETKVLKKWLIKSIVGCRRCRLNGVACSF